MLTGTPTVGTDPRSSLSQLHRLLGFLREPALGLAPRAEWNARVLAPFLAGAEAGEAALLHVLRPIMVRHTKKDLHLPDPRILVSPWDGRRKWVREGPHSQTERQYVDAVFSDAAAHVLGRVRDARLGAPPSRPVKAVVYASGAADLEQFGHHVILPLKQEYEAAGYGAAHAEAVANEAVALHYVSDGRDYRASELSRFRYDSVRCRTCTACGLANDEDAGGDRCSRPLIQVRAESSAEEGGYSLAAPFTAPLQHPIHPILCGASPHTPL